MRIASICHGSQAGICPDAAISAASLTRTLLNGPAPLRYSEADTRQRIISPSACPHRRSKDEIYRWASACQPICFRVVDRLVHVAVCLHFIEALSNIAGRPSARKRRISFGSEDRAGKGTAGSIPLAKPFSEGLPWSLISAMMPSRVGQQHITVAGLQAVDLQALFEPVISRSRRSVRVGTADSFISSSHPTVRDMGEAGK